ncbi:DUF6351 family protein [Variovorax brevis]|uniref:DUF6351 family protein n=1 Tax=Variovorax brevis TaxID=3053503 RepID=UPI0033657435
MQSCPPRGACDHCLYVSSRNHLPPAISDPRVVSHQTVRIGPCWLSVPLPAGGGGRCAQRTRRSLSQRPCVTRRLPRHADCAPVAFTGPEKLHLQGIFPQGVCDFSKPAWSRAR